MDRSVFVIILLFAIVTPYFNLRYQMQPLQDAARNNTLPQQYSLIDVLILFGMLGLTGALLFELSSHQTDVWVLASVWFPLIVYWLYAVRWLSKAGVSSIPRRFAVEAVAMPIGTFSMLIVLLSFVAIRLREYPLSEIPGEGRYVRIFDWPPIQLSLAEAKNFEIWMNVSRVVLTLAWFFLPRRIVRWAAASVPNKAPTKQRAAG